MLSVIDRVIFCVILIWVLVLATKLVITSTQLLPDGDGKKIQKILDLCEEGLTKAQ
jgi:hypothetical protein